MILPFLVSLLTAGGLLLRGSWDLWAQSLLHLATILGFALWLAGKILTGFVPLPSQRTLVWVFLLFLLGFASSILSPIHGLTYPEWFNLLNAVWIFWAMAAISKDERFWIDEAVRVAGWVLMILALYQHFSGVEPHPSSALVNPNVFAGAVLMILPIAVQKRDWFLMGGLLCVLWWTRSVGAWLGLSIALALNFWRRSAVYSWIGLGMTCICAVVIYAKFQSPEMLYRLRWWESVAHMILERPILGFGAGSFEHLLPAFRLGPAGGLSSIYAHNTPLQMAAELGLPFVIVWFAGILHCLKREVSYKRFGGLAALVQSLWDYTLSMPGNLWMFSYLAASSIPESQRGVNIPLRQKLPLCVFVLGVGLALASGVNRVWSSRRLTERAVQAFAQGDAAQTESLGMRATQLAREDPLPYRIRAQLKLKEYEVSRSPADLLTAAAALEKCVQKNPYHEPSWLDLIRVYRLLGRNDLADQRLEEATRLRPSRRRI